VETADSSTPRIEAGAAIDTTSAGGRNQLMQLVPLFAETKQFLRKVETVDKSAPMLNPQMQMVHTPRGGWDAPGVPEGVPPAPADPRLRRAEAAVPKAEAGGRKLELPPPVPTGQVAALFAEWGVPVAGGGSSPAEVDRHGQEVAGPPRKLELAPPAPTAEVASFFAEWGVPAPRQSQPREVPRKLEVRPPVPTAEVLEYLEAWGVPAPAEGGDALPPKREVSRAAREVAPRAAEVQPLGGTDDVLARFTASLNAATQVSEFRL